MVLKYSSPVLKAQVPWKDKTIYNDEWTFIEIWFHHVSPIQIVSKLRRASNKNNV